MTTRIEVADAQFVGPKYRLDRRHGDGTLLHLNPRHPAGKWADGVPADGALLPNIARLEAADLIGPTTPAAALAATFRNTGFVGSDGLAERTTKGGLHVITSRNAAAEHYLHIDWPTLVASFITGAASSLYICLIGRTTRRGAASPLVRASSATGGIVRQSITEVNAGGTPGSAISGSPTSGANYLGRNFADSPGLFMVDTATSGPPSTWPAGAGMNPILGIFGNLSASTVGNTPAWIFYDLIVEDLTRSKRTYTEAHALSQEYYTRELLTPGGLYYGDTYTAPAA